MVGEPAVGLHIPEGKRPSRNLCSKAGDFRSGHAAAGVDDDLERSPLPDERKEHLNIAFHHGEAAIFAGYRPWRNRWRFPDQMLQCGQSRIPAERDRVLAAEFEPVHPTGQMRCRHHGASVEPAVDDGIIEERRAHHPDIGHRRSGRERSLDEGLGKRRRGEPHVPPDDDRPRVQEPDETGTDPAGCILIKLVRICSPDIICLEDRSHVLHPRGGVPGVACCATACVARAISSGFPR